MPATVYPLLKLGARGAQVRRLQTMLCAAGQYTRVDGDFGAATAAAVRAFQAEHGLRADGEAGPLTWAALARVLTGAPTPAARQPVLADARQQQAAQAALAIALDELAQGARETGGENRGPWVRKYTGGHEGGAWPWCAAFATWCYAQACRKLKLTPALTERYSSSRLYKEAQRRKLVLELPAPGCIFVVRGGKTGYRHTGLVREVGAGYVRTVEGNATLRDEPGPDVVCSRWRATGRLRFIAPGVKEQ